MKQTKIIMTKDVGDHHAGEQVDLDPASAAQLVDLGYAEEATGKGSASTHGEGRSGRGGGASPSPSR